MIGYSRLNDREFRAHRLANRLQTVLLFCGMLGFLGLIGYLIAGLFGVLWALVFGLASFVVGQIIAPALVLRLYQARLLTVGEAPGLYQLVRALVMRAGLANVPLLYYVPSSMLNAFTLMLHGRAVIGVTDGLLRNLDTRELAAALAHEVGHIRHQDLTVMGLADAVSRLTHFLSMFGQILLLVSLPMLWVSALPIPWLLIFVLMGAPVLNNLLQLALSRTREFDADLEAVWLTGDPEGFIGALEKIEYQGLGLFERIFFPGRRVPAPSLLRTHPETSERIARIRSLMDTRGPSILLAQVDDLLPFRIDRVARTPRWRWGGLWY